MLRRTQKFILLYRPMRSAGLQISECWEKCSGHSLQNLNTVKLKRKASLNTNKATRPLIIVFRATRASGTKVIFQIEN